MADNNPVPPRGRERHAAEVKAEKLTKEHHRTFKLSPIAVAVKNTVYVVGSEFNMKCK